MDECTVFKTKWYEFKSRLFAISDENNKSEVLFHWHVFCFRLLNIAFSIQKMRLFHRDKAGTFTHLKYDLNHYRNVALPMTAKARFSQWCKEATSALPTL